MTHRILLLALLATWPLAAQPQAALRSPKDAFGFEMGTDRKLANWPEIVAYSQELARASDRVDFAELGKTTLGKPFIALTVSSPQNLAKLDHYRTIQKRLADPRGLDPAEAERLIRAGKAIVLITCNIHSTEIASSQTALEFVYRLATARDHATLRVLDNTILLLVPSLNPDGQQMVVEWYRKYVGTPYESAPLPELYHHYTGHDNNRDWYMFTQVETRHTIARLHNVWHPQIVYDVHQMGARAARIFVPPWMDPVDPNIDPILQEMTMVIGGSMATDLTAAGKKGVVVNAMYDLWTPSRHYQNYHAGIRILTESASARIASPITVRFEELDEGRGYSARQRSWNHPDPWPGGQWRLGDIVDYQLVAFRSCMETAARERERLLRNFYLVGKRACERTEPFAYVFPAEQKDPVSTAKLLETLRFGMVEVHRAEARFAAAGRSFPAGSHVIPLAQPYGAWAKTLLETQSYPDLREYPGGPPKRPYDVTAQTLPLLMGVRAELVREPFRATMVRLDTIAPAPGRIVGAPGRFGYVLSRDVTASSRVLNRILKKGFRAVALRQPLVLGGKSFAPGAVYLPAAPGLDGFAAELARETSLDLYAADRNLEGGGGELAAPRVGLYKSYVPSMDEGWTRWLLEQFEFPYRSLVDRDVRSGALQSKLDAIVIPDATEGAIARGERGRDDGTRMPEEFTGGLGEQGIAQLVEFVEAGGTLVTLNKACEFALRAFQLPVRNVLAGASTREFYCPGSLLRVSVDTAHPLAYGLGREEAAWVEGGEAFETSDPSIQSPLRYAARGLLMSGWLLGGERLQGAAAVVVAPRGKGSVVLLGFRPQYRGQSYATFPLLFNALYGSAMRPRGGSSGR